MAIPYGAPGKKLKKAVAKTKKPVVKTASTPKGPNPFFTPPGMGKA